MDYSVDCTTKKYSGMTLYAALMVLIYPLGIPFLYLSLLFKERATLSIPEHRQLATRTTTASALYAIFCGFHARTSVELEDKARQRELDEEWEEVKEEHYLSFLISPYV